VNVIVHGQCGFQEELMPILQKDGPSAPNLEHAIERHIVQRTWGRVYRLQVNLLDNRIVVHGRTSTYYAKQLALEAALDALGSTDASTVELDIHVGSSASPTYRTPPWTSWAPVHCP
jgi:hypothetical protein